MMGVLSFELCATRILNYSILSFRVYKERRKADVITTAALPNKLIKKSANIKLFLFLHSTYHAVAP